MDPTYSYVRVIPDDVLERYELRETRNAAAVVAATDPGAFAALVDVLRRFALRTEDLTEPGRNESGLAGRLNESFRSLGWREARVDTGITLQLRLMPHRRAGERHAVVRETAVSNAGYKVDNFVNRIALDVEWNAKDGNLDRDVSAYRALYEFGLIDAGILLTRTQEDLRALALRLRLSAGMNQQQAGTMLATTTTTNLGKLEPRLTRGDGGGCPILAVAICARTWEGSVPDARASDVGGT